MSSTIDFSFLNPDKNKILPPNLPNAGVYSSNDTFSGKPWGNNYLKKNIEPTSESFTNEFFAKNHIPSTYRPGNNAKPTMYEFINVEKFNTQCYRI